MIADPDQARRASEKNQNEIGEFDTYLHPGGATVAARPLAKLAMIELVVALDRAGRSYRAGAALFDRRNRASVSRTRFGCG